MNCPQCGELMSDMSYEGAHINTCPSCGGEFIDAPAIAHIVNTREQNIDPEIHAQVSDWNPVYGVPDHELQQALTCPACQDPMTVINYAGDSGVYVNRCDTCSGLWLDHLELEKVQALLDRWAAEAPAQIHALSKQLEAAQREADERGRFNFRSSRFSFVNALLSRLLDAA